MTELVYVGLDEAINANQFCVPALVGEVIIHLKSPTMLPAYQDDLQASTALVIIQDSFYSHLKNPFLFSISISTVRSVFYHYAALFFFVFNIYTAFYFFSLLPCRLHCKAAVPNVNQCYCLVYFTAFIGLVLPHSKR